MACKRKLFVNKRHAEALLAFEGNNYNNLGVVYPSFHTSALLEPHWPYDAGFYRN